MLDAAFPMRRPDTLITLLAFALFLPLTLSGQNESDALRYSRLDFGGTARYIGMSGAFGAVGADLSVLSTNPGGIALFRKSEVTLTPALALSSSESIYKGQRTTDQRANFNLNNIGYAGIFPAKNAPQWKSLHFGITYNRLINFHQQIKISGKNTDNTLLDAFVDRANGTPPANIGDRFPFTSNLAWQTYLIDPKPNDSTQYTHRIGNTDVKQTKTIERKGSLTETGISFGADFRNRFYMGMTLGFPSVDYEKSSDHKELSSDTASSVRSFNFHRELKTTGNGFNLKLGMIVRLFDWLRIGGAVHTPTYFTLKDRWSRQMSSEMKNDTSHAFDSPEGEFDYRLRTPARYMGSATILFWKRGLISIDFEHVDYGAARLNTDNSSSGGGQGFDRENDRIARNFVKANNLRIGGEFRLPPFLVRGGYATYPTPFQKGLVTDHSGKNSYSLGVGYRGKSFFMDLAYSSSSWPADHYLYSPDIVGEPAKLDKRLERIVLTGGFRF